jgi:hypothetical protein
MTPLHPIPIDSRVCPHDRSPLDVVGWYMPGMRRMADLRCRNCAREFYGDLPSGWGLYYPCLIEKETAEVHSNGPDWYSRGLRDAYRQRGATSTPVGFTVEQFKPLRRPVLLNVLDGLYGHSILPLLGAQHYLDHTPDFDLVVMVPKLLRWMVPQGCAQVWTLDVPLRRGAEWNDWVAGEIRRRVEETLPEAPQWWLSLAFPFPHPAEFSIERFTGVRPFDYQNWRPDGSAESWPIVTFIWRDDRTWPDPASFRTVARLALKGARRVSSGVVDAALGSAQRRRVVRLGERLRRTFPKVDFGVVGPGRARGLPAWMKDLRATSFNPQQERDWCRRYAASHLVIGIHGSNLILPSAHAAGMIELVPPDRWPNLATTVAAPTTDVEHGLFRYTFLPAGTRPAEVAAVATHHLRNLPLFHTYFSREWTDHARLRADPFAIQQRYRRARGADAVRITEARERDEDVVSRDAGDRHTPETTRRG